MSRKRSLKEIQEDIRTLTRVPSEFIHAKLDELAEEIGELARPKWIPCSEKLPEVNISVLAQWGIYYSGENRIDILYLNEFGRWHGDSGEPNGKVIAWMPLPTPYEKGE